MTKMESREEANNETLFTAEAESSGTPVLYYLLFLLVPPVFFVFLTYKVVQSWKDYDIAECSYLTWFRLLPRLAVRVISYPRQGRLHLDDSLVYVAGGSDGRAVKSDCTLQLAVRNHKLTVNNIRINKKHLDDYKRLCGYGHEVGKPKVPICYPETLFLRPLINVITSKKFCLSPLGLIHLRQTIKQHVSWNDYLDQALRGEVIVKRYCEYDSGVEVDIVLRLIGGKNTCIWEGTVTLLSRKTSSQKRNRPNKQENDYGIVTDEMDVPADCGLKYAQLTGDWNPHHLYSWSAFLLGYEGPIAHGMWTLSRALAQVERRKDLGVGVNVFCAFKRPLLMPSRVAMKITVPNMEEKTDCKVNVEDKDNGIPHADITVGWK